jgi:hypothetical protein
MMMARVGSSRSGRAEVQELGMDAPANAKGAKLAGAVGHAARASRSSRRMRLR